MLKQAAFLFVALFVNHTFTAFMRNKYVVDVEKVEPCPNNAQIGYPIRNLKFLRYNRTHKTLSYDFTYAEDLDENVGGSVVVERWGDGGWITIPFMGFKPNMCHYVLTYFKSLWVDFHKNVGVRHPDRCPVPAVGQLLSEELYNGCHRDFCALLEWSFSLYNNLSTS